MNTLETKKTDIQILSSIIKENLKIDVSERTRKREVVDARRIFYKILRDMGMQYTDIGKIHSKDHSTIIHAVTSFNDIYAIDVEFRKAYKMVHDLFFSYKEENLLELKSKGELIINIQRMEAHINGLMSTVKTLRRNLQICDKYNEIISELIEHDVSDDDIDVVKYKLRAILNGLK